VVVHDCFLNNLEKILFLSGLIVCPITAFFYHSSTWTLIYVSCNKCQLIFVAGAVLISLNRYDSQCWTDRAIYFAVIAIALSCAMSSYFNNIPTIGRSAEWDNLDFASYLIAYFAAAVFLVCTFKWFYKVAKRKFSQLAKKAACEKCDYFPLIYVTVSVVCVMTFAILSIYYDRIDLYDETALLVNNLIYTTYALFMIFISMRMVKSEVIQGLVSTYIPIYIYMYISYIYIAV
jgi:hypothetical protein